MSISLARRVLKVKPSPTLAVSARAACLRAQGKNIIGLGAGEPDFDTPEHIKDAARAALSKGYTKYTAVDGIPELKQAIVEKFKTENGFDYRPENILVSCGGKQSFYNLAQAVLNPGDEVIIPAPYWVSYPDIAMLADGIPVIVGTDQHHSFKMTATQLERHINPMTKMVVINSPSNPSGMAYSGQELAEFGEILRRHPDILIVTDDMYEHIMWSAEPFCNILNQCPDLADRTMVLNGVSKAYSMTGWRIGYAGGPVKLIEAMTTIQSQSTSNPTSISQYAALAALQGNQNFIKQMCQIFKERHDFVVTALNQIPGIQCLPSMGTFYAFPSMHGLIERTKAVSNDMELAEFILQEALVALVPGTAFGTPGHLRLSFATSMENLQEAITRLKKLFQ